MTLTTLLRYLDEDAPSGDLTSEAIISPGECGARITAKCRGTIAGLDEAKELMEHLGTSVKPQVSDGDQVESGTVVLEVWGDARKVLLAERTVLNIIGRMSAIATKTRRIIEQVRGVNPDVRIASTRKTAPGMRVLDKKAVVLGGGEPHRYSLSDGVLIKDNHLALVPIDVAIRRARDFSCYKKIEVEADTVEDAVKAAKCGADIILLDNMAPDKVRAALAELRRRGLRDSVMVEASGRIAEESVMEYAATGVDVISMGALTHTVRNFDVGLEVVKGRGSFTW